MVGEPRRKELMRRLTAAVCGTSKTEQEIEEAEREAAHEAAVQRELAKFAEKLKGDGGEKFNDMPSALYRRAVPVDVVTEKPSVPQSVKDQPKPPQGSPPKSSQRLLHDVEVQPDEINVGEYVQQLGKSVLCTLSESEATEMKRNIKRLQNRRAVAIANLLSGPSQDPALKSAEKTLIKAEAELSRVKGTVGATGGSASRVTMGKQVSSVLIDSGSMMDPDVLVRKLEQLRADSKLQIKSIRVNIKTEAEAHVEYGLDVENAMALAVRDSLHETGKQLRSRGDSITKANEVYLDESAGELTVNAKRSVDDLGIINGTVSRNDSNSSSTSARSVNHHVANGSHLVKEGSTSLFQSTSSNSLLSAKHVLPVSSETLKLPSVSGNANAIVSRPFQSARISEEKAATTADAETINNSVDLNKLPAVNSPPTVPTILDAPLSDGTPKLLNKKKNLKSARFEMGNDDVTQPTGTALEKASVIATKAAVLSTGPEQRSVSPADKVGAQDERGSPMTLIKPQPPPHPKLPLAQNANSISGGKMDLMRAIHKQYEAGSDDDESEGSEADDSDEDNSNDNVGEFHNLIKRSTKGTPGPMKGRANMSSSICSESTADPSGSTASIVATFNTAADGSSDEGAAAAQRIGPGCGTTDGASLFDYDWLSQLQQVEEKETETVKTHSKNSGRKDGCPVSAGTREVDQKAETDKKGTVTAFPDTSTESAETAEEDVDRSGSFYDSANISKIRTKQYQQHHPPHNNGSSILSGSNDRLLGHHHVKLDVEDVADTAIEDEDDESVTDAEDNTTKGNGVEYDTEEEEERENAKQIRSLRKHVHVLIEIGDVNAAERLLERCLELNPLEIRTLRAFAVFLHRKKGELARAEAFFRRALQVEYFRFRFF
jgi:ribosomal protein S6